MMDSSNNTVRYGNDNGGDGVLDLEFYVHSYQYVPFLRNGIGMVSLVHDNREIPRIEAAGIELAPGRKHKLAYKMKKTFLLPLPYTACTDNVGPSMQAMLTHYNGADYGYGETICYQICAQIYTYERCGCIKPTLWNTQTFVLPGKNKIIYAPLCKSNDSCFFGAVDRLLNSLDLQNIYCTDCFQQCSVINFFIQTSSLTAPAQWQMDGIKTFVENSSVSLPSDWSTAWHTYIQENYVAVSIVRETNLIENYTQIAQIDTITLLSNIGGQSGLWIGISFLSLMEFIEMIYLLILYQWHLIRVSIRNKRQIIPS